MYDSNIISKTLDYAKATLDSDSLGHDFAHVYRVFKMSQHLSNFECADRYVVELAAALHDIADWKFCDGDDSVGPNKAEEWLLSLGVDKFIAFHVKEIIKNISFKGANVESSKLTLEGQIVQDADRLDAIGAIGIGRTFAYGGAKGRQMYDPSIEPVMHNSFDEYKSNNSPTINHFYEKLFLLESLMNTTEAKKIARERTEYMKEFVNRFKLDWDCNL